MPESFELSELETDLLVELFNIGVVERLIR